VSESLNIRLPVNVTIFEIQERLEIRELEKTLSHDPNFRNNFWFTSIARYIYLANHVKKVGGKAIHIESDVILSRDFPFAKIAALKSSLAFPVVSKDRGIGSVVYVNGNEGANLLIEACLKYTALNPNINDMEILGKIFLDNQTTVYPLPTGPNGVFQKLLSTIKLNPTCETEMECLWSSFGGYFDGNDYGPYLTGLDPRNHRGRLLRFHENASNYVETSSQKYIYDSRREFVGVQELNSVNKPTPLFNLHIHSKQRDYFDNRKQSRALQTVIIEKRQKIILWEVVVKSIYNSILRRLRTIREKV
jgi:hypothetical protein